MREYIIPSFFSEDISETDGHIDAFKERTIENPFDNHAIHLQVAVY